MCRVTFWQKPGCSGNARQRAALEDLGCKVQVRDLFAEPWTSARLRKFFDQLPVPDWFNRSAPRVKSGEVLPERLGREEALALLLSDPLLIRRPLMRRDDGACMVGFDAATVTAWLGLAPLLREVREGCAETTPCAAEERRP